MLGPKDALDGAQAALKLQVAESTIERLARQIEVLEQEIVRLKAIVIPNRRLKGLEGLSILYRSRRSGRDG